MRKWLLVAPIALLGSSALGQPFGFEQRENALWDNVKSQRLGAFAASLAPGYVGVYSDGIYDKAGQIAFVRGQTIRGFTIDRFSTRTIDRGEDVLVTYRIRVRGNKGAADYTGTYWGTSLWHRTGNRWMVAYHSDIRTN